MSLLKGKNVLITGGSRGIGKSIVQVLIKNGANVGFTYSSSEDAAKTVASDIRGEGGRIELIKAYASDSEAMAGAVREAAEVLGGLNGLINNAGIDQKDHGGVVATPVDVFRTVIEVNQVGTFLGMNAVAPAMISQEAGSIVNISSVAGMRGLRAVAYVASKWAVRGMTKTAAAELGSSNIRVNSIHPGAIETDMLFDLGEDSINWLVSKVPMQRSGTPDEVGETAMFLLSDEASYISGAEIVVDGALITR